ncbi:hypothetical protein ACFL0P_04430 [Candidatus Omnitrophota bacterium]
MENLELSKNFSRKEKSTYVPMTDTDFRKDVGTPFFPTSTTKLIVMSVCTLGIYEIFWFYKNWKFLKEKHNFDISPFWRAWFCIFTCYSFFKIVKAYANQHKSEAEYKPGPLTLLYILLFVASRAPDPLWIFSTFSFVPLLSVQKVINNLKDQLTPDADINNKFSTWNIIGIALGSIVWVLIILRMILPK